MLQIMHSLKLEWSEYESGAKHAVEWSFHEGQREGIIEAIYKAIKEEQEGAKAARFATQVAAFPEVELNCPTCLRKAPKKQKRRKKGNG